MVQFSRTEFYSFLQYFPHPGEKDERQKRFKEIALAVKNDGTYAVGPNRYERALSRAVLRLSETLQDSKHFLHECFTPDCILVPMPRSGLRREGDYWPALRICEELVQARIGQEILPCIRRATPVRRSSTAGRGERVTPTEHYESVTIVDRPLLEQRYDLVLIDDVITRGSSLLGVGQKLAEVFIGVAVQRFAMISAMRMGVPKLVAPLHGPLYMGRYGPIRENEFPKPKNAE